MRAYFLHFQVIEIVAETPSEDKTRTYAEFSPKRNVTGLYVSVYVRAGVYTQTYIFQ